MLSKEYACDPKNIYSVYSYSYSQKMIKLPTVYECYPKNMHVMQRIFIVCIVIHIPKNDQITQSI